LGTGNWELGTAGDLYLNIAQSTSANFHYKKLTWDVWSRVWN